MTQKDNVGGTSGGYAVVLHEEVNNPSDEQFADEFHKNLDGKSLHGQVPQTAETEAMKEALDKPSGCSTCTRRGSYVVQLCRIDDGSIVDESAPFTCKGKAESYKRACNAQLAVITTRYYRVTLSP